MGVLVVSWVSWSAMGTTAGRTGGEGCRNHLVVIYVPLLYIGGFRPRLATPCGKIFCWRFWRWGQTGVKPAAKMAETDLLLAWFSATCWRFCWKSWRYLCGFQRRSREVSHEKSICRIYREGVFVQVVRTANVKHNKTQYFIVFSVSSKPCKRWKHWACVGLAFLYFLFM